MSESLQAYVHVTNQLSNGYVEFNFALGDPSLYIEMILPRQAFREFCENNQTIELTSEQVAFVEEQELKWRYGTSDRVALME